jgi:hypothetical protein
MMQELDRARYPKHRESGQTLALGKTVIASFGIGAIAVSGFTAFTVEAEASTSCPAGTTATVDREGTCEKVFTFTETNNRTQEWTTPAGVTDFQALLVGGGGAALDISGGTYGGGGGSVTVERFDATAATVEIVVGRGGQTDGQAGSATVLRLVDVSNNTFRTVNVSGGVPGQDYGNDRLPDGGPGAGGPQVVTSGGPGLAASSFVTDAPLFENYDVCFGGGGAGESGTVPECSGGAASGSFPRVNSGGGGSTGVFGADGIVIIRFAFGPQSAPPSSGSSGSSGAIASPIVTSYSKQVVTPGALVEVRGQRLETVQSAKVNGKPAQLTAITSGRFNLRIPAGLPAGTYDLELLGSFGTLIETSTFTIEKKRIKRLVPGFAGDSPVMTKAVRKAIRDTTNRLPGAVNLVCTGSTSNTRVTAFDKRLARDRATRACARAKSLIPDLTTQIRIEPASGLGPRARNIKMVLRNY